MIRPFLLALIFLFPAATAGAGACQGSDTIAEMPADTRAELVARANAYAFSRGLLWHATRGTTDITLFGTFHIFDATAARLMRRLTPLIAASDIVFLEATKVEIAKLKTYMNEHPELLFTPDGPTLPEVLSETEWQRLSAAMKERHIPPFLASKMNPWMVSVTLNTPYCVLKQKQKGRQGLDFQIMTRAGDLGIETRPLEAFDTVFRIFGSMSFADQIDMVRSAINSASTAEDSFATLRAQYLAENVRMIWELSRQNAYEQPDLGRRKADKMMQQSEDLLLNRRNTAWVRRLLKQAEGKKVMVAVGALHLSGDRGLLSLLQAKGFTITRLPLEQ